MMERYDKYKPSRVMWLPTIPSHWEMSKAKYYFQYTTGFTPPTGVAEFYDGDITWVTIADMNQKVVFDSATKLSQTAIDKYNPDLTLKGSLLYSFKLSVGKVAYAGKDLYTNEAIISILPNEEYDVRYFYYTLPEQLLQNANENIYGAKMLNQELIRNASICFPPKEEQTAIANYLDEKTAQIDTLITNKQTLIELLKEERTAIINQAVTKGINPKVKLKPSGIEWLGDIPEHWDSLQIRRLTNVKRGASPRPIDDPKYFDDSGEFAWVRIADVTASERYLESTTQQLSELGASLSVKRYPGDFFLSIAGTVGKPIITKIKCCIHDGFVWFPKLRMNPEYLYYIFSTGLPYQGLGKWGTQLNLNTETVGEICIPLPPETEINRIVAYLDKITSNMDATISKIEKEIELLQEYRTALISEVVTGKIKVT